MNDVEKIIFKDDYGFVKVGKENMSISIDVQTIDDDCADSITFPIEAVKSLRMFLKPFEIVLNCETCECFNGESCEEHHRIKIITNRAYRIDSKRNEIDCDDYERVDV